MDYSLLVVREQFDEISLNLSRYYKYSRNQKLYKNYIIHIGIIDFLQTWDFNKKIEALYKKHIKRKNGSLISAIEPIKYS